MEMIHTVFLIHGTDRDPYCAVAASASDGTSSRTASAPTVASTSGNGIGADAALNGGAGAAASAPLQPTASAATIVSASNPALLGRTGSQTASSSTNYVNPQGVRFQRVDDIKGKHALLCCAPRSAQLADTRWLAS